MKKTLVNRGFCETSVLQKQPLKNACFVARRAKNCKASAKLTRTEGSQFCKRLGILVIVLVLSAAVPAFSQEIFVSFGVGGQFIDHDREWRYGNAFFGNESGVMDTFVAKGFIYGINVMFIGETGFTISANLELLTNPDDPMLDGGTNLNTIFGLGYVYYDKFYIGGILNFIYNSHIFKTFYDSSGMETGWANYGLFLTPTLVGGYDFGKFFLGGQLSYMIDPVTETSGFKFSMNAGVNVSGSR